MYNALCSSCGVDLEVVNRAVGAMFTKNLLCHTENKADCAVSCRTHSAVFEVPTTTRVLRNPGSTLSLVTSARIQQVRLHFPPEDTHCISHTAQAASTCVSGIVPDIVIIQLKTYVALQLLTVRHCSCQASVEPVCLPNVALAQTFSSSKMGTRLSTWFSSALQPL